MKKKSTKEKEKIRDKKKAEFAACKTTEEMNKVMHKYRSYDMLTVQDVIDYLKTQNPNACVLGYESNSRAYIEQFKDLPNMYICTVKEMKKRDRESLDGWYKHDPIEIRKKKIKETIDETYRYSEDDDVIFNIGN